MKTRYLSKADIFRILTNLLDVSLEEIAEYCNVKVIKYDGSNDIYGIEEDGTAVDIEESTLRDIIIDVVARNYKG